MSLTGTVSLGLALPNHPLWWWLIASLASFLLGWHPVWGVAFLLAVLPIIDCSVSIGGVHHGSFHLFMMLGCSALCAGRVMSRGDQSFVVQSPIRLTPWSFSVCALWLAFGWLSWLRAPVTAWGDLSFALSSDHTGWIAAWSTFLPTAWVVVMLAALQPWRLQRESVQILSAGVVTGLGAVVCLTLWERWAHIGMWNLNLPYRTTAWFWEMRLGGGALDAYLAMTLPFAWGILLTTRRSLVWSCMALLLVAAVYTLITTFSRAVLVTSLLTSAGMLWTLRREWSCGRGAKSKATMALVLILLSETVGLFSVSHFMTDRLVQSSADAAGRLRHWQALASLPANAVERLLGVGMGQLPTRYDQSVDGRHMPAYWRWVPAASDGPAHIRFMGNSERDDLRGRLQLVRSLPDRLDAHEPLLIWFTARQPTTIRVAWCEQHLLYEGRCLEAVANLPPTTSVQRQAIPWGIETTGDVGGGQWRPFASTVLKVALLNPEADMTLSQIQWGNWSSDFSKGLAPWWPSATGYFLPWHADNLYLELWLERGMGAVLTWLFAVWLAWRARAALPASWCWAVAGLLVLGLLISVFEFPRTSFFAQFLVFYASFLGGARGRPSA